MDIMVDPLRIVLASFGPDEFATLHSTCVNAGHRPVAYVHSRSMKPGQPVGPGAGMTVGTIVDAVPSDVDLLLPAGPAGLAACLPGYRPDLLVVFGFNWKIPAFVREIPRLGAINIHGSLLPKYRGPAPVLWAIRNGDPEIGVTIHRMDDGFDTGPILAQTDGIPIEDDVSQDLLRPRINSVIPDLLRRAIELVRAGFPGERQNDAEASYAGFLEPESAQVDWSHTARQIHNQVRTLRYIGLTGGPVAKIGDQWVRVLRTRLTPTPGATPVACADGKLWILESEPADKPDNASAEIR